MKSLFPMSFVLVSMLLLSCLRLPQPIAAYSTLATKTRSPRRQQKRSVVSVSDEQGVSQQPRAAPGLVSEGGTKKEYEEGSSRARRRGWKMAFGNSRKKSDGLGMEAEKQRRPEADENIDATVSVVDDETTKLIKENFERHLPSSVFPYGEVQKFGVDSAVEDQKDASLERGSSLLDEREREIAELLDGTTAAATAEKTTNSSPGFRRKWFKNILTDIVDRRSNGDHSNLRIRCTRVGNVAGMLFRGQICCDASMSFDSIGFPRIRFSGGNIEAKQVAVNLWSFASSSKNASKRTARPRYPGRFDVAANNLVFAQDDLMGSPCIRDGLQRLLTRILKKQGMDTSTVDIKDISILPSGKLAVQGEASTFFGSPVVPFQVRTGISTASRGHVLTFPGLEISLGPNVGLFVPILPEVALDIGNNAQLERVEIDGSKAELRLDARVTITPEHTIPAQAVKLQKYRQSTSAYAARFSVDVGGWLTRLGKFSS